MSSKLFTGGLSGVFCCLFPVLGPEVVIAFVIVMDVVVVDNVTDGVVVV